MVGAIFCVVASVGAGVALTVVGFYPIPYLLFEHSALAIVDLLVIAVMLMLSLGLSHLADEVTFKRRVLRKSRSDPA